MATLPTGTLTFLFTDVEGSTRLWEQDADAMRQALARHDAIIDQLVAEHHGSVVRPRGEGDSRFVVFPRATDAIAASAALQRAFYTEAWPTPVPLKVRIAVHTGEADVRDGDYYGSAVNRAARLRSLAYGGQTLVSHATVDLVQDQLPIGVGLRDLGFYQLKDLTRPEQIYQLVMPDLPADFPSLNTSPSELHSLPIPTTSFHGRERELQAVQQRIRSSQVRLLTLTGPGGTGKSRLALQAAARLLGAFPGGVYFVPLAPVRDPTQVLSAIAKAMDIPESSEQPMIERLSDAFESRELLLILDNFEHVIAAAPDVGDLLAAAPTIKILVTSREPLHLAGEWVLAVPPLELPDLSRAQPAEILQAVPSVALFIERARAVNASFTPTPEVVRVIAAICVHLDGLPLAIELAAARSSLLSPMAILARLQNRLQLLRGRLVDAPARHQTLRDTIAWSYDLLKPPEQAAFRRLGVLVGSWTVGAAGAVIEHASEDDVLDLLTSLVDKALVQTVDPVAGTPRFRLLETIREYALERLEEHGELARARALHAYHYAAWAEEGEPKLYSTEQGDWLRCLDEDHGNLLAALEWSTLPEGDIEVGARLYMALNWYWFLRSFYVEGRNWCIRLVSAGPNLSETWRARLLVRAGALAYGQGDLVEARTILDEGIALAERTDQPEVAARGRVTLGYVTIFQGQYEDGAALIKSAIAEFRRFGDHWSLAVALNMLGRLALAQGQFDVAEGILKESLGIHQRLGDTWGLSFLTYDLGRVAYGRGNIDRAEALELESLRLSERTGLKRYITWAKIQLGRIARRRGDHGRAIQLLRESIESALERGDKASLIEGLEGLASVAVDQGRLERAARLFGAMEGLRRTLRMPRVPVDQAEYASQLRRIAEACPDAWDAGQASSLQAAVVLARTDEDQPPVDVDWPPTSSIDAISRAYPPGRT